MWVRVCCPYPAETGTGREGESQQKDYNTPVSFPPLPHRRDYYKSMESYGTGQVLS